METDKCRRELGDLIDAESASLVELAGLLEHEHGYLESNDVVSLEGASRERQRCVARIFRIDEQRRALCRDQGYTLDLAGLEAMMRWCDPERTLTARWAKCAAAAARCRELNDRNGALVTARLQHVQARLGVLIDSRRELVTYGPRGAYGQSAAGRVLTTEA